MSDNHDRKEPPMFVPPRPHLKSVDLDKLEDDVVQALERQRIGEAVEHVNEEDLGRLSAEAVVAQYESAARAVEDMGLAVKESVHKIAASLLEADKDMKEIAETAAMIRDKGNHVQAQIEAASALSTKIREACADFRKQVGV